MAVPAWAKYKTKIGKDICKFAMINNIYYDGLECDLIAGKYPNFFNWSDSEKIELLKSAVPGEKIKRSPGRPKKPKSETRKEKRLAYLREKNADSFKPEIIKAFPADVVLDDIEKQKELYKLSIESVYSDYIQNNPQKIAQHPSKWKNDLFCKIKNSIPRPNTENIDLLIYLWDLYKDLCYTIGCTVTVEGFSILTGLFYRTFKEWEHNYRSSPKHMSFLKNIVSDSESMLLDDVAQSPITRGGSIFLLKARYGYTENSVITHVSATSDNKNVLDIPCFNDSDSKE